MNKGIVGVSAFIIVLLISACTKSDIELTEDQLTSLCAGYDELSTQGSVAGGAAAAPGVGTDVYGIGSGKVLSKTSGGYSVSSSNQCGTDNVCGSGCCSKSCRCGDGECHC